MLKQTAREVQQRIERVWDKFAYKRRIGALTDPGFSNRQNVLIITIDCLRNDHLSRMGYERATTPFLDSLSIGTEAIAAAPWTYSSVPSILSGVYPHRHGARYQTDGPSHQGTANPSHSIADDIVTLPELFGAAGYSTRFDTAIATATLPVPKRFGTINIDHDGQAREILTATRSWWNSTQGERFAYVQLGDLHEPLHRPEPQHFGEIPDIEDVERWSFGESVTPTEAFETYREARIRFYDTVLRYVDEEIKRFLENLDDRDDTIVVVTSDHGEEFWEYRDLERERFEDPRGIAGIGHGHALVPPVIEVPILSDSLPVGQGDGVASSIDIAPSIVAELAPAELPETAEALTTPRQSPPLCQEIAYGPNQISVTSDGDHLITIPHRDETLLLDYDSGTVVSDEDRTAELQAHLPDSKRTGSAVSVSDETKDRLADLGYR